MVVDEVANAIERNWLSTRSAKLLGILAIVACSIGGFSFWMTPNPRDATASDAVSESASQLHNDRRIDELQTVIGTLQMEIKQLKAKDEASSLPQNEMNEFKRKAEEFQKLMLDAQNKDAESSRSLLAYIQKVAFELDRTNRASALLFDRTADLQRAIATMLLDSEGTRSLNEKANAVLEIFKKMDSDLAAIGKLVKEEDAKKENEKAAADARHQE